MTKPTAGGDAKPPGMVDVARVAGVSAQTVSRVLSGHAKVLETTRMRVLAAVDELGYRKNSAARILSSGRSRLIGVVTHRTDFYAHAAITAGIENGARAAGYSVSAAATSSLDTSAVEAALSHLVDQGVEGIVLAVPLIHHSTRIEQLTRSVPTIALDGSRTDATAVVTIDQAAAARLATRHLLDLGHETVWHISGPRTWNDAAERSEHWRLTLEQEGRTVPPPLEGDWSPASGYRNGLLLGRIPEVTAVFVASDEMAFGVIRALHELGRRVPQDISVVGVDDIALAEYCSPSLTTVAQPFGGIGRLAVTRLIHLLDAPAAPAEATSLEPELIVRASTAPRS